jgi:hypothetical protein
MKKARLIKNEAVPPSAAVLTSASRTAGCRGTSTGMTCRRGDCGPTWSTAGLLCVWPGYSLGLNSAG